MKKWIIGLVAAMLVASPAIGQTMGEDFYKAKAYGVVADKGIPTGNVDQIIVSPWIIRNDGGPINGVSAFVDLKTCNNGYLVVQMNPSGLVTGTYTNHGCQVAEVPAY